jgi:uncharacterized membrane protein
MNDDDTPPPRYDTNPLPRLDEAAAPEVDTEAPTQPMPNADPAYGRETAPYTADTNPYATMPSPDTRAAYRPPDAQTAFQQLPGPPAVAPPRPVMSSVTAQYGVQQNFAAMACYLPFIGLVASVLLSVAEPPENRFVRFHAKQSIIAHACFWAGVFAFSIARAASPTVVSLLLMLPQLAYFVATIAGFVYLMVKAYRWQMVKIPIIGEQVK